MVANAPRRGTLPPRPAPRLAVRPSPAPASPLVGARLAPRPRRLVPSAFPRERKTELRSHRHHQHHAPCVAGQLERHETPDPVRSNAV